MNLLKEVIKFKSTQTNYEAEESDLKCCTVRTVDLTEEKHRKLVAMKLMGEYGVLEINKIVIPSKESFRRRITYIEYWKDTVVICWKPTD